MKVGITGVTGFVGSGIACDFLKNGHQVLAVSRNDIDGQRSKAAIRKAWLGYGYDISELNEDRVEVVSIDFATPLIIARLRLLHELSFSLDAE